ncbi:MAG: MATE family efflux transporter [Desulfobacteraceae bacterium]
MGDGPLTPVILRLAGPVVLMMYLQGAYNIIDSIWVGQLLGKMALAAIATGGFVLWSIFGLTNLVTVGVMATVARRIGEDKLQAAEQVATRGLWYAFVLSFIIGAALWFLIPVLYEMMGTDPQVTRLGSQYLRVLVFGCPLIFLSFLLQRIFQAAGDTVTPMWLMFLTLILNAGLDPVLMLGLFGFPQMGVAGAAMATVIARLAMVLLGIWLLVGRKRIGSRRVSAPFFGSFPLLIPALRTGYIGLQMGKSTDWDWRLFGSTLRIGVPNTVSQVLFPLVYMIITRIVAAYGPIYIAALRIGHTVEGVSFFLALGFSIATATCLGQNLGAQRPDRAERAGWIATGIVVVILFVYSVFFFFLSHQIGAAFTPDPDTIGASATYLEILAISQVFMGIEVVLAGAFSGAGDTVPPMAIFTPFNIARIPAAYLLAGTAGLGISGVWWAISGTSIIKGLIIAFWFYRGRWKRRKI